MIRYIIAPTGQILTAISGDAGMVSLNTASDAIYVDTDSNVAMTDYYDFDQYRFVSIGEAASPHQTFDYRFKQWIDGRTLDAAKEQKWHELKAARSRVEFGGFVFEGNTYDSDQISQGRIFGAAMYDQPQIWTLADNSTVSLTATQMRQLCIALQQHVAAAHARGRYVRQQLVEANTIDEVDAIAY